MARQSYNMDSASDMRQSMSSFDVHDGDVVFSNTFVSTMLIGNTEYLQNPYSCNEICYQCVCPCCIEVQHTGHDGDASLDIFYKHGCLLCPCCCQWAVDLEKHDAVERAGELRNAGLCDNGCFACMCPCFQTGRDVTMKFVEHEGGPVFSTRQDSAYGDCCKRSCGYTVCLTCVPCGYCSRFLQDTPYRIKEMPFFAEDGKSVDGDDGAEPAGYFIFVDQLHPMGCCCCPYNARSSIRMAPGQPTPTLHQIAMLSMYTELGKGIVVSNPCAWACVNFCTGVPTPTGHSWADTGKLVDTNWVTPQQMNAYTRRSDLKISEARNNFGGWGGEGATPGSIDVEAPVVTEA